jgi:hypothetical protein
MPPILAGQLADHPDAEAFARVIQEVHHRYAMEVVGAFRLCPFMKDPETAFGRFCVVFDREPSVATAKALVLAETSQVAHLIYPLVRMTCAEFERFGGDVHKAVAATGRGAPVHATFHPDMGGDRSSASRIVGLMRRAPDPFLQFVPEGLHGGGTTFIDVSAIDWTSLQPPPSEDNTASLFDRLGEEDYDRIAAVQDAIKKERDERYRRFLDAMA